MSGRVLVTGSEGFVGAKLSAYLADRGYTVLGCDLQIPDDPMRLKCDLTKQEDIDALIHWAGQLDYVVHLAAITFVPEALNNPGKVFEVNLQSTIRLTTALREHTPKVRILYIGSSEAYGAPCELPVTEEHPLRPNNPYAISKAAADMYCGYLAANGLLDVVRMRPFNHSGPGQADSFVLASFAKQIAAIAAGDQDPVLQVGNLDAARDFMHVDDVVRAYELALKHGKSGEAYNICSGASVKIQDALDTLIDLSGVEVDVQKDPDRMRPSDIPEIRGSHEKFTEATDWRPKASFDRLLRGLLDYWRVNV